MRWLIVAVVLLTSCDPHPGCDAVEVEAALAHVSDVLPEVADISARMQVFCLENTSRLCVRDVDACTVGVGLQARMAVRIDVPVRAALAHEAWHWYLWDIDPCVSHNPSCGWDYEEVERLR